MTRLTSVTPAPARSPTRSIEPLLDVDTAIVRGFARAVGDQLDAGPLTLSARDRLLTRAQRLGIRRFDANLIVAAVEQNARSRMRITQAPRVTRRSRWLAPASAALVVQTLIALGAWWVLS